MERTIRDKNRRTYIGKLDGQGSCTESVGKHLLLRHLDFLVPIVGAMPIFIELDIRTDNIDATKAGAAVTNGKVIADKVRAFGNYGSDYKYHHIYRGNNSRLDELQAAFLLAKLPHLNRMNEERRRIAKCYLEGINNPEIILPFVPSYAEPVWHVFAVRSKKCDELAVYLADRGISTNKHYSIPVHMQNCYKDLNIPKGALPIAEEISATELSLPMFYGMTNEQIEYVIDKVNMFSRF